MKQDSEMVLQKVEKKIFFGRIAKLYPFRNIISFPIVKLFYQFF